MPWCHACDAEYIGGMTVCPDCGAALLPEAPPGPEPDTGPLDLVRLTAAADGYEADMLEAMLRENGIPVIKRHREAGAYMSILFGRSAYGVDILVSGKDGARARELLEFLRSKEFDG